MALCKDLSRLRASQSIVFDRMIREGTEVLYEGIYACCGCAAEVAAVGGKPFPDYRKRAHTPTCGNKWWRLLIATSPGKAPDYAAASGQGVSTS